MKFGLLGIPWDFTASLGWPGSRYAPAAIRDAFKWIAMRFTGDGFYWIDREQELAVPDTNFLVDRGDVAVLASDLDESFRRIAAATASCWNDSQTLIAMGGDDGVTFPVVKGLHDEAGGSWGLIHLDAHLDLMDRSDFQGSFSHSSPIRRITELARVDAQAVVQVGGRNFNFTESHQYAETSGIVQIPAASFWRLGTEAVTERVL